jgi:hypothetical protein
MSTPAKKPRPSAQHQLEQPRPREIEGCQGSDPTRYGNREIGGRCIDF